MTKKRLISGIQPTGKMHLGNYLGSIQNWVALQETYDAFFMVVDLHSLTTVYDDPSRLRQDKLGLAIDLLSAGIDPKKSCLFNQSDVPEHAELHLILSMVTPLPWLQRVPSYKGKQTELKEKDLDTYGFLGYPVLQAADILLYKGDVVPVGKDQLPHLELTREISRRFNHFYKKIFPEPQEMLTRYPILPGTDGRKMSKSYKNTLPISDKPDDMKKKVLGMLTDPKRVKRTDPGDPSVCPVFSFHQIYSTADRQKEIDSACRSAEVGCVDCKRSLADNINESLASFQEKRAYFETHISDVQDMLIEGSKKAREVAGETLKEVKDVIGL
jgi:tryptophanyl-tRNA synthetase